MRKKDSLKFVSWNVNGLRAIYKKNFKEFITLVNPDILCLQEIKADKDQIPERALLKLDYHSFFNSAEKKGYAGTAIYTKIKPLNVTYDLGINYHDKEGRVITAEFPDYFLVNVYTPNSQRGLTRLEYRQIWDQDFLRHLKKLEKTKPVILCGDLNVAHKEIDLARPQSNRRNAGFTDEEREGISKILNSGFLDTFRIFNQEGGNYTWWSYQNKARERNIGWRIDYFCVSESLKDRVKKASIMPSITGSDHCPVTLEIFDELASSIS